MAPGSGSDPGPRAHSVGLAATGDRWRRYLEEVRAELRKTTWPTREELISQTQIVLLVLVIIGGFIFVWDLALKAILDGIFRVIGVR